MDDLICHRCKKPDAVLWSHTDGFFCDNCAIFRYPPMLTLTKLWSQDTSRFYNPKVRAFDTMDLDELIHCGFVLYRHKQYINNVVSPFYSDVFVFRFFGQVVCNKFQEYDNWPIQFRECDHCAF